MKKQIIAIIIIILIGLGCFLAIYYGTSGKLEWETSELSVEYISTLPMLKGTLKNKSNKRKT